MSDGENFYLLMTTGDFNNEDQVFIEDRPSEMGIFDYRLSFGEAAGSFFPPDARVYLRPENTGRDLSDIIGNSRGYFIGSTRVKMLLQNTCAGLPCEFFPFSIYDEKGILISRDYYFINPLVTVDCLNYRHCNISRNDIRSGSSIKEIILDAEKTVSLPLLFRIKEIPNFYVMRQSLAELFVAENISNFISEKLSVE